MSYFNGIKPKHIDILKEIGNIGAGHSATALSTLLNKKIDMKVPVVRVLSFDEMMDLVGGPDHIVASVFLRIEGDAPGSMFFVLSLHQASRFIQYLTGEEHVSYEELISSELGLSALQELGNILSGSYLSSLSDFTNLNLYPTVPAVSIDMVGAILGYGLIELSQVSDYAIIIDAAINEFDDEDYVKGHFFLLPDPDSFEKLFHSLGVNNDGTS
ncbi:chemotaxis protein CheC [Bacillus sp. PS06]|uniref:chemotaxis protein CheC n=1 Tax=Bacillus sp. PS06 TaxID=2764176 RepID=UPI0017835F8D|nr:chemotaxis protein CheC [Bacillus sp. PS06]MBD8068277.1 chemotaxis protein CheC [Bacillus sp. PS06]